LQQRFLIKKEKNKRCLKKIKIDKQINLKGEVCPYTYVKSKLAIEKMEVGEVLEIILNHKPAVENVPRSMENEEDIRY
jgi:TusA-related sulfurtransferase